MKKIVRILSVLTAATVLLSACASSASRELAMDEDVYYNDSVELYSKGGTSVAASSGKSSVSSSIKTVSETTTGESDGLMDDRKLIKTYSFTLESLEFDQAVLQLKALASELGGYVESSEISGRTYSSYSTRCAELVLRLPAEQTGELDSKMAEIGNVTGSSENVQDITLSYTDTASRVKALEAQRDSLLTMLEKAETLEDLLTIQDHLTDVESDLECYASQLRLYDNQVDYSTVNVYLSEVKIYSEPEPETFFERLSQTFKDSLEATGEFFEDAAIFLLGNLPGILCFLTILALIILLLRKVIKKAVSRRRARKEARQISNTQG